MAFVDGQNLYRHAKEAFGHHHPNYDVIKLHQAICEQNGWRPTLVRFYTGIPSAEESPMWAGYWSARILAMKRAGILVTTRPIRYHKKEIEQVDGTVKTITVPHEKGIDVRLALDVISCTIEKQFDVAVIYSQDQDLGELPQEVFAIAKQQGRNAAVACAFPSGPNASSNRGIDRTQWIRIDQALYDACLDRRDYRPKSAR